MVYEGGNFVHTLINTLMNTLTVSIPEELFLVGFSIVLLSVFKMININRKVVLKIFIPVIFIATITNILSNYGVTPSIKFILSLIIMFLILVVIYSKDIIIVEKNPLKFNIKVLASIFIVNAISFTILIMTELSYMAIVLQIINKDINEINNNVLLNLMYTLPERALEYALLFVVARYKILKEEVLRTIIQNKKLLLKTILTSVVIILFMVLIGKAFVLTKLFQNIPIETQLISIMVILLLPILHLTTIYTVAKGVSEIIEKEKAIEKSLYQQELDFFAENLKVCTKSGDSGKMIDMINEIKEVLR